MNYINFLVSYEIVDLIENAISEMDLKLTDYVGKTFTYIHGLPIDVRNEHKQLREKLPVVLLFEPLEFSSNMNEMENDYKTGSVRLFFLDSGTRGKKDKQTEINYKDVIEKLGKVTHEFMRSLENQKQVSEITEYNEKNWSDFSVNVEQRSGANKGETVMYQGLTGKEISFEIKTHKIYNC